MARSRPSASPCAISVTHGLGRVIPKRDLAAVLITVHQVFRYSYLKTCIGS